ncbi:hypothetical protein ABRZ04_10890 [Castellaniella ginsengisoli]|uniref:Uncharacterized protein n=1 Tax=Castellaniella ginsengisoli TaxID=546114 RepID=A0AB39D4I4_9BURK
MIIHNNSKRLAACIQRSEVPASHAINREPRGFITLQIRIICTAFDIHTTRRLPDRNRDLLAIVERNDQIAATHRCAHRCSDGDLVALDHLVG